MEERIMKTIFKFIIAAMAASAVFASCQKELATGNSSESTDGIRVISASFSAPTKSALDTDGKTPKFVGGEEIKVSNETESQVCTISIDASGNPYFSTSLTGTLTAVYPSTAAKMNGNVIDDSAVLVSTVQNGTFASANIAMATGITTSARFTNKTAVIAITPGAGSNSNYVEVITAGPEIANNVPEGSTFTKLNKIHVNVNSATTYPVYVSILVPSGLKVKNLSFADGKNIKTAKDNTTAIAVNTINTVSNTGWATPYVEINGLKWATMNIGATNVNEFGKFYSWGNLTGQSGDNNFDPAFKSDNYISTEGYNIDNDNHPWTKTMHDAAYNEWGDSWRMPTKEEFIALDSACGGSGGISQSYRSLSVTDGKVDKGKYRITSTEMTTLSDIDELQDINAAGLLYSDGKQHYLFSPAAGYSVGTSRSSVGTDGRYWSSTWYDASNAYLLDFRNTSVHPAGCDVRFLGGSVRPVSD